MRIRLALLLMLGLLCCVVTSPAQTKGTPAESMAVKRDLLKLFRSCKADRYREAAAHIIYRGTDAKRKWTDVYDYAQPAEREEVKGVCLSINELLKASDAYEFARFFEETESEGRWLVWELDLRRKARRGTVRFALLKVKGRYALGDIDGHLAYLRSQSE